MEPPEPAQIATDLTSVLGLSVLRATCTAKDIEKTLGSIKPEKWCEITDIEQDLNAS